MLPNLRIDFSLIDYDVERIIKDIRAGFEEEFAKTIKQILETILLDAPKGLPVLTGQAKKGFEDIAERYGVAVTYNNNILRVPEYDDQFDPDEFPSDAVRESVREGRGFREWNMEIDTSHFLENDATRKSFKNQQTKTPWGLLDKAKGPPIEDLRKRLVALIGKTRNRWAVKLTRKNPHLVKKSGTGLPDF